MNKVFLIFSLFTASFFFLTSDVKAATYTEMAYNVDVKAKITDDFLDIRKNVIDYAKNNSYHYIFYSGYVYFTTVSEFTGLQHWNNIPCEKYCKYDLSSCYYRENFSISSSMITSILDTNVNLYYSSSFKKIIYGEKEYLIDDINPLPSVYKIYSDLNSDSVIKDEQLSILNNFYSVIIEKLNYLANEIINNYVYLSIFTIFIIIFIFQLIFRRFL